MKKFIVTVVLFILGFSVFSQAPFPNFEQIEAFKKSKTLVVLEKDAFSMFNPLIKKAVKQGWNVTPYEFVSYDEFLKKKKDPAYSFLVLTSTAFERDKVGVYYDYLNIILGDPVNNLSRMPEFCSFPLEYSESEEVSYQYALPMILKFMQKHVKSLLERPNVSLKNLRYYNKNLAELPRKTLWVVADDLAPEVNTEEKIMELYDHPVRVVARETLDKTLQNPPEDMAFLFKIGPEGTGKKGRIYKTILGVDGTLYYFNYHLLSAKKPDGMLKSDFKKLGRY